MFYSMPCSCWIGLLQLVIFLAQTCHAGERGPAHWVKPNKKLTSFEMIPLFIVCHVPLLFLPSSMAWATRVSRWTMFKWGDLAGYNFNRFYAQFNRKNCLSWAWICPSLLRGPHGIRHGLNPFKNKTKKVIHYNTKKHTYWHILLKNIHVTDFYPLHCFDVRIDRYWHWGFFQGPARSCLVLVPHS